MFSHQEKAQQLLRLHPTALLWIIDLRISLSPSNAKPKFAFPKVLSTTTKQVGTQEATSPTQAQITKRFEYVFPFSRLQMLREEQIRDSTAASSFKGQNCSCPWTLPSARRSLLTPKVAAVIWEAKHLFVGVLPRYFNSCCLTDCWSKRLML